MRKEIRNLILILCVGLAISFVVYQYINPSAAPVVTYDSDPNLKPPPMVGNMISAHSFTMGPIEAKAVVVEFFDPECETCASVAPFVEKEMKFYNGKVRWAFRYMAYHFNSKTAIHVLEAARKQNLFLEVQHALFESQKVWGEQKVSTEKEILEVVAKVKKIKMAQLKIDMQDPAIDELIAKDKFEGEQAGVNGTPTFFVNGVILEQLNLDLLIQKINQQLQP